VPTAGLRDGLTTQEVVGALYAPTSLRLGNRTLPTRRHSWPSARRPPSFAWSLSQSADRPRWSPRRASTSTPKPQAASSLANRDAA